MKYDFDYLKDLYIDDPVKFEQITTNMIDDAIDNICPENREIYKAKQWRLEQDLAKIKDPLERMNRMVGIFWNGVENFRNVINDPSVAAKKSKSCNIISFKNSK